MITYSIDISDHTDTAFTRSITLSDVDYNLHFIWNGLYDFWNFGISNQDYTPLFLCKAVCNYDILHRYKHLHEISGKIIFEGNGEYPRKNDFQNKVVTMKYIVL
jgi:hypothetical protein